MRSFDPVVFREATKDYPDMIPPDFDVEGWLSKPNIMWEDNGDVGLATLEYPGVYNMHWFFKRRGREALELGRRMLQDFFDNHGGKLAVGITRADLKAARWASRQLGFKSQGLLHYKEGDHEMFCLTREDFYKGRK